MKNYIIILPRVEGIDIDLLIPNVEQDTFTIYPLDKAGPSKHYGSLAVTLDDIMSRPDRITLIPTSASTVDDVLESHPELFI